MPSKNNHRESELFVAAGKIGLAGSMIASIGAAVVSMAAGTPEAGRDGRTAAVVLGALGMGAFVSEIVAAVHREQQPKNDEDSPE